MKTVHNRHLKKYDFCSSLPLSHHLNYLVSEIKHYKVVGTHTHSLQYFPYYSVEYLFT